MQNWKSEVDYHVVLSRQYISEKIVLDGRHIMGKPYHCTF